MTPDQVRDMTDADRAQLVDALARRVYGEEYRAALARDFGISRQSLWRWTKGDQPVPWAVLYALSAWIEADEMRTQLIRLASSSASPASGRGPGPET